MTNYEIGKEKIMEDFEKLIEDAGLYSYDEVTLKSKMINLLNHLDACVSYSNPGMK